MRKRECVQKFSKGFTLIEIMVVVIILGVLATFVVPKILDRPDQARVTKAQADIKAIEAALKLYRLDNGFYPTTEQGLVALVRKPEISPLPRNWKSGGYLDRREEPKDPWGNPFAYRSPAEDGRDYEITSYGADGELGGEGVNADIRNE
ncbi:type II secretion system major pseudopilin GspG [Chrysiogenes arsenatis]|uniref:type II secretion system major pseudopilin GspG n=1 Tax=Chrysiogenes arsenatis TaxID=309797 RepID=UPI0004071BE7|nr:type II secretion system major pseudopilin GspG [Chrysiogenes arsenatis]